MLSRSSVLDKFKEMLKKESSDVFKGRDLEVAVFPLKDVLLFPRAIVPLNIFEKRYLQMVHEAIESSFPIALAQPSRANEGKNSPDRFQGAVAGIGRPKIIHRRKSGELIILLEGHGKVELQETLREEPYILCRASLRAESESLRPANRFRLNRLRLALETWAKAEISDRDERRQFLIALSEEYLVIQAASLLLVPRTETQQALLEIDNMDERLEALVRLIA